MLDRGETTTGGSQALQKVESAVSKLSPFQFFWFRSGGSDLGVRIINVFQSQVQYHTQVTGNKLIIVFYDIPLSQRYCKDTLQCNAPVTNSK